MEQNKIFAQDGTFWENYGKGRPRPPQAFFDRIFDYHQSKGGTFGTVHDVGAGNGPYARQLRQRFQHVILSDIISENVELARKRFIGLEGFSFRASMLEDIDGIDPGSVDMLFATNVMHFPDPQAAAVLAIASQLRPGGTFAVAAFGPARFHDPQLQDLWARISHEGGRQLLRTSKDPAETIRLLARTQDSYNVAPLDGELFELGVQRICFNMATGGIQRVIPPEEAYRNTEPSHTGPEDVLLYESDSGWNFEMDPDGVREHFQSFPFVSQFPNALKDLYNELDDLLADKKSVVGVFPAVLILATRR